MQYAVGNIGDIGIETEVDSINKNDNGDDDDNDIDDGNNKRKD